MKILIVDDDTRRSGGLVTHLTSAGVAQDSDIVTASCIGDAKHLLKSVYYDVLILDVVLPQRRDEGPSAEYGIAFLGYLNRSSSIKKPEKIIGVTAHLEDIGRFRATFENYCLAVIEAGAGSSEWKGKVVQALSYTAASQLARSIEEERLQVLAVHGIRTFGHWQDRLANMVSQRTSGVGFSAYKYGYFSAIAFLVPAFRDKEVSRLKRHMQVLFERHDTEEFIIFCHSFGTYLVAHALRQLVAEARPVPVRLLVLCGSVLPNRFDWGFLERVGRARVVNDCADKDFVLWLSEAFVLSTGMAGKTGFYGIQGNFLVNRHFTGGHSCYFDGDQFMQTYWLPLLDLQRKPSGAIDIRRPSLLLDGGVEKVVCVLGMLKPYIYTLAGIAGALWLGKVVLQ